MVTVFALRSAAGVDGWLARMGRDQLCFRVSQAAVLGRWPNGALAASVRLVSGRDGGCCVLSGAVSPHLARRDCDGRGGRARTFCPLRRFALAAAPRPAASVAGLGSDLASVGQSVWARIRGRSEAGANATGVGSVSPSAPAWLTPGRLWIGICLCGLLIGGALAGAELREGSSAVLAKRLLIVAVYAGLETAAMLLGFALLRRPLRLSVI